MGYNIGSELRKLRLAILQKSSSIKNMWTTITLTSKHKDDNYFHYDLLYEKLVTARIENLIYISCNKILTISKGKVRKSLSLPLALYKLIIYKTDYIY